jgi:hypothetical protein
VFKFNRAGDALYVISSLGRWVVAAGFCGSGFLVQALRFRVVGSSIVCQGRNREVGPEGVEGGKQQQGRGLPLAPADYVAFGEEGGVFKFNRAVDALYVISSLGRWVVGFWMLVDLRG